MQAQAGQLKNFFSLNNLKSAALLLLICVLLVFIEICLKYFNSTSIDSILLKESNIVDFLLNNTKQ